MIQNSLTERSSNSPSPQPFTTHWSSSSTQYISSSTSGGITGALIAIISSKVFSFVFSSVYYAKSIYIYSTGHGLRSILLTLLGGMGMGFCAQAGYNGLMIWRRKKAIELYCQDLGEGKRSRFENWTFVSPDPLQHTHTSTHMHMHMHTHPHVHTQAHIHTHTCTHTCTHTSHTHAHTWAHAHTHGHISPQHFNNGSTHFAMSGLCCTIKTLQHCTLKFSQNSRHLVGQFRGSFLGVLAPEV